MSEEEQLALLATSGMLVKRPMLVGENTVLVGFRKFRSKVSTMTRRPVSCSKVRGAINSVAWRVITVSTAAPSFTSPEARAAAL